MRAREKSPRLERQFANKLASFRSRLAGYLSHPDAAAIHGVRTSFRRLEACYSIFPAARRTGEAEHFMALAREFFSLNSLLRDCDIMLDKLQQSAAGNAAHHDDLARLRTALEITRQARLDTALELAHRIEPLPLPHLHADQRALRKGLRAQSRRRVGRIVGYLPAIRAVEHDSEQIHAMRKQVKKLHYLLELRIDPARCAAMAQLKEIQTLAGEIHDCDVTLAYLSDAAAMVENGAALRQAEQTTRHALYRQLLERLDQLDWKALQRKA